MTTFSAPFECEFYWECNEPLPADHILNLPHIARSRRKLEMLELAGIERIDAIPEDFPLSEMQQRARRSVVDGRPVVEGDLRGALAELSYPLTFMDFETVNPAIPRHTGMRPYQQIPFQWSVHVKPSPRSRKLEHQEFLAANGNDPREAFIDSFLGVLENGDSHIVVYNQTFEEGQLTDLARWLPRYAKRIERVRGRLWDLLPVVKQHVYDPAFAGSFSLKSVLPALVPEMTYEDMAV